MALQLSLCRTAPLDLQAAMMMRRQAIMQSQMPKQRSRLQSRHRHLSQTQFRRKAGQEAGSSRQQETIDKEQPFMSRLRKRLRETPVRWTALPFGAGVSLLIVLNWLKQQGGEKSDHLKDDPGVKVNGPWQVHVIGALPLKTLSRIYGRFNEYTLPHWFRVPGFKFYGWLFGVNFDEVEKPLEEYTSLSDFFMRHLKEGSRSPADALLISPADGTVVNFGYIEDRRVENVKGKSYSMDALLGGIGPKTGVITEEAVAPTKSERANRHSIVNEEEFAKINDINYTLDKLIGDEKTTDSNESNRSQDEGDRDASMEKERSKHLDHASVAFDVGPKSAPWTVKGVPRPGNKMFFCVVYLGPGDYHLFHSPAAWVVERRRHFAGELFSVSPYIVNKLADLFVLNERVALLGRWRHGFFSMVPVGATNVGRIIINFDRDLHTNARSRETQPGRFSEANYASASRILQGQALRPFDEMGGFMLGSTIVLVFEAPESFKFQVEQGQKVKVGQALGT